MGKKMTLGLLVLLMLLTKGAAKEESGGTAAESPYVLREYEGCVAIYCGTETAPSTVTDIEVRCLPSHDREMLGAGLGAADVQELSRLLEDLGS